MTIEQLTTGKWEELARLTDTQLIEIFRPYLQFTRPSDDVKTRVAKPLIASAKILAEAKMLLKKLKEDRLNANKI